MTPPCGVPLPGPPRPPAITFIDDGRLQEVFHQREHRAVDHPFRDRLHQPVVRNRVEVGGDVGIDDPAHPVLQRRTNGIERIVGGPSRTKAVRVRLEVRLEERFQQQLHRRLDHAVANVGNAQRPFPAIQLRDVHPSNRSGSIRLRLQFSRSSSSSTLPPVRFNLRKGPPSGPGAPPLAFASA